MAALGGGWSTRAGTEIGGGGDLSEVAQGCQRDPRVMGEDYSEFVICPGGTQSRTQSLDS